MKTSNLIQTILCVTMFVFFTGYSSYAIKPEITPAEKIQTVIKETVKYPEKALKSGYTGSVDVLFQMNDDGQIMIRKLSSDNNMIGENVRSQLLKVCCKDVKFPYNQYYQIRISFKLEG